MTRSRNSFTRKTVLAALTMPLALGLAGCGDTQGGDAPAGDPIAEIEAPEGQSWTETVQVTDRGGYLVGNPDAPIKLVEYGSLTCPGCAGFANQASEPLMQEYVSSGRVSFELRSFVIHGPIDLVLTRLIGCSTPEAAVPLADQVWANLQQIQQRAYANPEALNAALQLPEDRRFIAFAQEADLFDFFAERGISREQAASCLADFSSMERLAELSQSYAQDDKITGTPSFLLNGSTLDGTSWAAVEAALQRAGAR